MGVQSFDTSSYDWTNNPPLLDAAASVAVSLNRNLVAQTKDSIKIFSTDVLASGEARSDTRVSHVYPLGEKYIICVIQPTRRIAILELETLREVRRDDETLPFWSLPADETELTLRFSSRRTISTSRLPCGRGGWIFRFPGLSYPDEDTPRLLYGLSPAYTTIAAVYIPSREYLWVNDTKHGDLTRKATFGMSTLGAERFTISSSTRKPGFTSRSTDRGSTSKFLST
jgi:hypothetical protein